MHHRTVPIELGGGCLQTYVTYVKTMKQSRQCPFDSVQYLHDCYLFQGQPAVATPNSHMFTQSSYVQFSNNGQGQAPQVYQATSSTRQAPGGVSAPYKHWFYSHLICVPVSLAGYRSSLVPYETDG